MYVTNLGNIDATQRPITQTVGAWSLSPTIPNICIETFGYMCPSFSGNCYKDFHRKAQLFEHATFRFYRQLFCLMGHVPRRAI